MLYLEADVGKALSFCAMLSRLTRRCRVIAAATLAAAYALCVLAPSVALAFVDGPTAFHCLTDQHGIASPHDHERLVHVHADGTTHRHGGDATHKHPEGDGKSHPGDCCGLFCMIALASEAAITVSTPTYFHLTGPAVDNDVAGRGPDRINRPPIA